jgi:hypothetical protein
VYGHALRVLSFGHYSGTENSFELGQLNLLALLLVEICIRLLQMLFKYSLLEAPTWLQFARHSYNQLYMSSECHNGAIVFNDLDCVSIFY